MNKEVEINKSIYDGHKVTITNNGFQWNRVCSELSEKEALIIAKAFEKIGYKFNFQQEKK